MRYVIRNTEEMKALEKRY